MPNSERRKYDSARVSTVIVVESNQTTLRPPGGLKKAERLKLVGTDGRCCNLSARAGARRERSSTGYNGLDGELHDARVAVVLVHAHW